MVRTVPVVGILLLLPSLVFSAPRLTFSGNRCAQAGRDARLAYATGRSCRCVHRALDALENHRDAVRRLFPRGINFGVFFANPTFYLTRLHNRARACEEGSVNFRCVGYCHTRQATLAYVRIFFGYVVKTVNVCDEMFDASAEVAADTVLHEMGRLEGIGDSPRFDTDNIYVWDAIVGHLCEDATYESVVKEDR